MPTQTYRTTRRYNLDDCARRLLELAEHAKEAHLHHAEEIKNSAFSAPPTIQ